MVPRNKTDCWSDLYVAKGGLAIQLSTEIASVGELVAVFHINASPDAATRNQLHQEHIGGVLDSYGAEVGTGRVCSGERSLRHDLNGCSVGGGDLC